MPKVRNDEISIHAAREGGDAQDMGVGYSKPRISIHAAREGGDSRPLPLSLAFQTISIHAAREGGDYSASTSEVWPANFNPRRP